jgi:DNA gyrase subunit A
MVIHQFMMQWCVWLKVEYALPLVDGQGNFGSVDGDSPAATAKKLEFRKRLWQISKKKVDFQLNFDDTLYEPKVMPTRVPTLLINGATGMQ